MRGRVTKKEGREDTNQMRVFQLFEHRDVIQLDVEELVDRFQGAGDRDVVFELDGNRMVDESFKETVTGVGELAWAGERFVEKVSGGKQ